MDKIDKPIIELTKEEFNATQTVLGGALYKHTMKRGRPKLTIDAKKKPTDKIKCEICGKYYFRSGSTKHKRTQFHMDREKIHKKLLDLLID